MPMLEDDGMSNPHMTWKVVPLGFVYEVMLPEGQEVVAVTLTV